MYPLKYKLTLFLFLLVALLLLLYFIFVGFALLESDPSFIQQVIPFVFVFCVLAIISSPIILGTGSHWLIFFICAVAIAVISLGTGRYIYNLQSLIFLGVSIVVDLFCKRRIGALKKKISAVQRIKETNNMLKSQQAKTEQLNRSLTKRLERYHNLKEIGESFSAKLSCEDIYKLTVETAYNIVPESDAALLFVVDDEKQELLLSTTRVSSGLPRIKSKQGDIFDKWVFKERQPLNVEDIREDFRFDYRPLEGERFFRSLISVPLISQSRISGILRLNGKEKKAYTFDDLRLLDFVSDLASSAINNAHLYRKTEELSIKDSLTGFYIHRYLKERLRQEVDRAHRSSLSLSIIMIDIDHFKDYNDRYGHSAGDKVLLGLSEMIRNNMQDSYVAARYGGEEFVMILPNTDKDKAKAVAEKLRKDISSYKFILRRKETNVTISAGVASYSDGNEEELLKKADFCLYKAKKEGRNRVCVA